MTKLHVQIVTPQGMVYESDADFVVGRSADGDIGILPNHLPIIVPLEIDKFRVKRDDKNEDVIAVNGGVMEVRDNQVSILANSAELPSEIDIERAERAKSRAEGHLQRAKETHNVDSQRRAEVALSRALNRINVSKR
ncbi:F0F1 ATP synthase subunit epsilon [Vagococcus lutrae]|uniref:ATP synthase epsilon chain n=2 Tax=Vagococcus lutrae TaxID=81947 RepID=V6Q7H8_9ENTE|nr:F0F1 ATP synthase subunit epsilon [Vagococcus lutrae]MDO5741624.1 F0F1 ATP synthase subunit epsilon [Vagococcus sp.]EST90615.1 ATP synthase F1, epsilon subunit [Vagococcus lutrae LBD1]MCO7151617.1 F0F1 ATP synthase subunit epsilon [Vagococcus lutrae]MDT2802437.1 F0F1 ATP synthase subunit epsilon [Vagococcus lutrae]MDT2806933.1 F0F1 ATP synthase subunit epsilon [Vagococcus lutrae]